MKFMDILGIATSFLGLILLIILQLMLVLRLKKSMLVTTAVTYPTKELTDIEKIIRRSGITLCLIGGVIVLFSFLV